MNVKGKTIKQIMNIDLDTFNKLKESELRAYTSRLVSAGNKRIRRLLEAGYNSPAIQGLGKEKKFSTILGKETSRRQRVNKLRETFASVRNFLTRETSTIKGYKQYANRTMERIANELNMSKEDVKSKLDVNKLFELHHKAQSKGLISSYRHSKGSMQGRDVIAEILMDNPNVTEDTLMDWLENQYEELNADEEESEDETEEKPLWWIWINISI